MEKGNSNHAGIQRELALQAIPFSDDSSDLSRLAESLSHSRIVMLGESTQGTREFYRFRRLLSSQLIEKFGFRFVAFDGDWASGTVVNDFVIGADSGSKLGTQSGSARDTLSRHQSWPICPLRNLEVELFLERLRDWNEIMEPAVKTEMYGLDVYSFFETAKLIGDKLEEMNPALGRRLRELYSGLVKGMAMNGGAHRLVQVPEDCEEAIVEELKRFIRRKVRFEAPQTHFRKRAEAYYRTLMYEADRAWEVRDRHMLETLTAVLGRGSDTRGIVWAPNSRIVDYRATSRPNRESANLGGLAREHWGKENISLIGATTYRGHFTVSREWGMDEEVAALPEPPEEGLESVLHAVAQEKGLPSFYLSFRAPAGGPISDSSKLRNMQSIQEIGAIYQAGEQAHRFEVSLANGFDGLLFIDETSPVEIIPAIPPVDEKISGTQPFVSTSSGSSLLSP